MINHPQGKETLAEDNKDVVDQSSDREKMLRNGLAVIDLVQRIIDPNRINDSPKVDYLTRRRVLSTLRGLLGLSITDHRTEAPAIDAVADFRGFIEEELAEEQRIANDPASTAQVPAGNLSNNPPAENV